MMKIDTLLQLLKIDLGITHSLRDEYFMTLLQSSKKEIERKGVTLEMNHMDDQMLVVDYAAWVYRNRQNNLPLAPHLRFRIHNRLIQKAGSIHATN